MSQDTMERLSLPKKTSAVRSVPTLTEVSPPNMKMKPLPGIPPDPLPTWTTLPLDAKLPMPAAPKGVVSLYTTNIGEKMYKIPPELDFDLTDPYAVLMSNKYEPLHDPHLKPHLTADYMQRRLARGGFITDEGKVLCTLKEYNDYRQYLRKINLALDSKQENQNRPKNKRLKGEKKESEAAAIARQREEKVKVIKDRLAKQHEEDKNRYLKLREEEEKRRERMREEQLIRLTEKENQAREREEKRRATIKRRQTEERRRKIAMMRRWLEEDAARSQRAETRRKVREEDRQQKLEQTWDERKRIQQDRINVDLQRREQHEQTQRTRIEERENQQQIQKQRQQAMFLRMSESRRRERERLEEDYARNFATKMERKRAESARRRRRKKMKGKGVSRARGRPVSIWDLEKSILATLSDDGRRPASDGDESAREQRLSSYFNMVGVRDKDIPKSIGEIGLDDFKGASFNKGVVQSQDGNVQSKDGQQKAVGGLSGATTDTDTTQNNMEDIEKAAKGIVDMTVFLATQVIYPAYLRYLKEDFPNVYQQYFERPTTPLPLDSDMLIGGSGVQNRLVITDDDRLTPSEYGDDEVVTGIVYNEEPASPERKKKGSVRFSLVNEVITADDLLTLTYADDEVWDADDESEVLWHRDQEEDEDDMEVEESSASEFVETKDSLTFLNRAADGTIPNMPVDLVVETLTNLLSELHSGKLSPTEAQKVAFLANQVLSGMRTEASQEQNEATQGSPAPSESSSLAEQIVQQTLADVQHMLFSDKNTGALGDLAVVIVTKAMELAMASIPHSDGIRPASAPPATPMMKKKSLDPDAVKSSTSWFIHDVLQKVVHEVEGEMIKTTKEPSSTSLGIQKVLDDAVEDLRSSKSLGSHLNWDNAPVFKRSSASITGQFVRDTLAHVLGEMEREGTLERPRDKSSTSIFAEALVGETLQQCLDDIKADTMSTNQVMHLAGAFIQSAQNLSAKKNESVDMFRKRRSDTHSACSVNSDMVQALIYETLSRVKEAIQSGSITTLEILKMARNANVTTSVTNSRSSASILAGELTDNALADAVGLLPVKNISDVAEDIVHSAITNALHNIGAPEEYYPRRETKTMDVPTKSDASLLAEQYVQQALEEAIGPQALKVKSNSSFMAGKAVDMAIDDALTAMIDLQDNTTLSTNVKEGKLSPVVKQSPSSRSQSSLLAEKFVQQALNDAILESDVSLKADASFLAQRAVSLALNDAIVQSEAVTYPSTCDPVINEGKQTNVSSVSSLIAERAVNTALGDAFSRPSRNIADAISDGAIPFKDTPSKSNASFLADRAVSTALCEVLDSHVNHKISAHYTTKSPVEIPCKGGASYVADQAVQAALNDAMKVITPYEMSLTDTYRASKSNASILAEQAVASALTSSISYQSNHISDTFSEEPILLTATSSSKSNASLWAERAVQTALDTAKESRPYVVHEATLAVNSENTIARSDASLIAERAVETALGEAKLSDPLSQSITNQKVLSSEDAMNVKSVSQVSNISGRNDVLETLKVVSESATIVNNSTASLLADRATSQVQTSSYVENPVLADVSVGKTEASQISASGSSSTKACGSRAYVTGLHSSVQSNPSIIGYPVRSQVSILAEKLVTKAIDEIIPCVSEQRLEGLLQLSTTSLNNKHSEISSLIQNVLSKTLKDVTDQVACSNQQIFPKQSESQNENDVHQTDHVIHDDVDHLDDSSSEDEVAVIPMLGDHPIDIDHHIVENTLSILSVRRDQDLWHPNEAAARNSFRDLIHPDVSRVKRLSLDSEDAIRQQILSLSKHHISLPQCLQAKESDDLGPFSYSADHAKNMKNAGKDKGESSQSTNLENDCVLKVTTLHTTDSLEDVHKLQNGNNNSKESRIPKIANVDKEHKKKSESSIPVLKKDSLSSKSSKITQKVAPEAKRLQNITKKPSPYKVMNQKSREIMKNASTKQIKKSETSVQCPNNVKSVPKVIRSPKSSSQNVIPHTSGTRIGKDASKFKSSASQKSLSHEKNTPSKRKSDTKGKARSEHVTELLDGAVKKLEDPVQTKEIPDPCPKTPPVSNVTSVGLATIPNKHDCQSNKEEFPDETDVNEFKLSLPIELDDAEEISTDIQSVDSKRPAKSKSPNMVYSGRDSPAAEVVEEEELPAKSKPRKGYAKSSHKLGNNTSSQRMVTNMSSSSIIQLKGDPSKTTPKSQSSIKSDSLSKAKSSSSKGVSLYTKANQISAAALKASSSSKQSSHQMLNLTPRPSSGYRKSPTPQSVASGNNTQGTPLGPKASSKSIHGIPSRALLDDNETEDLILLTPKQSLSDLQQQEDACIHVHTAASNTSCTMSDGEPVIASHHGIGTSDGHFAKASGKDSHHSQLTRKRSADSLTPVCSSMLTTSSVSSPPSAEAQNVEGTKVPRDEGANGGVPPAPSS